MDMKTVREMARKVKEERKADGLPIYKSWADKVKERPESLRFRVNAKCMDCCLDQKEEIRKCTCQDTCSLWEVRPYK